jgi:signal transduction histidine kinase
MSNTHFATISAPRAPFHQNDAATVPPALAALFAIRLPSRFASVLTNSPIRYATALALTAVALLGRWTLVPLLGDHVPFALVYGAVVLSALYLGLGPSIAASVAGIVSVRLFFVPHFFAISGLTELSETLTYIGGCVLIISAAEAICRSSEKLQAANRELAAQAEALRALSQQLERRVDERTAQLKEAESSARQLGAQVLRMQDEERRRIARDLHDSVGQAVAILNMNLGQLSRSTNLSSLESAMVTDSKAIATAVSDEVRTISYLLHPPLLDDMGLPAALKWYVEGFSKRSGIATDLKLSRDFGRLPADCEIAIFRIVQESLTNIHRHSGSRCATVRVTWKPEQVEVRVEDGGKGISPDQQADFAAGAAMGVGLRGMRERVAQLGGKLDLQSSNNGTLVRATLPLSAPEESVVENSALVETGAD